MDKINVFISVGSIVIAGVLNIIALMGTIIARDRSLNKSIVEGDATVRREMETLLRDEIKGLEGKLENIATRFNTFDDRINNVNDRFVRRDDLTAHVERIEKLIENGQIEQRETNKRLDMMLAGLVAKGVAINPV
jgi:hypothetical protein